MNTMPVTRPRTAVLLGGLGVALVLSAVPLSLLAHQFTAASLELIVLMVPFAAVGVLVAARKPQNPIGWTLLALALGVTVGADAGFYAVAAFRAGHNGLPLARLAVALSSGWLALILLLPLPIVLFPDGKLPSPRWRWTMRVYVLLAAVAVVSVGVEGGRAFTHRRIEVSSTGGLVSGSPSTPAKIATAIWFLTYVGICVSWVSGQVVAYRQSTGERRQQLKWLMSGGATCIAGLAAAVALSTGDSPELLAVSDVGFGAVIALPVGIGVGILRYRLYDIDRLISRTISYAILTGMLVGVYVAIVALTTHVLPISSPVAVAASTLAAAALFNPLRRRVQHLVDRRFNRARYNADAIVAAFTLRLRDAVDLDTVRHELLDAVDGAVKPSHASIWIRPPAPRPKAG